jgi:hypothetical protein
LGGRIVKQFSQPAESQEIILAAFQEQDWAERVDDPLPPRSGINAKRRLHDTICNLNRHQKEASIHFFGDGTGRGVCWQLKKGDWLRPPPPKH